MSTDLEVAKKIIAELQRDKPYLFIIEDYVKSESMLDGIIDVQLRLYKGKVTDVVVTRSKRHVVKYGDRQEQG